MRGVEGHAAAGESECFLRGVVGKEAVTAAHDTCAILAADTFKDQAVARDAVQGADVTCIQSVFEGKGRVIRGRGFEGLTRFGSVRDCRALNRDTFAADVEEVAHDGGVADKCEAAFDRERFGLREETDSCVTDELIARVALRALTLVGGAVESRRREDFTGQQVVTKVIGEYKLIDARAVGLVVLENDRAVTICCLRGSKHASAQGNIGSTK